MAKIFPIFVCILIVALDVTAGILGIKAEMAQNQQNHVRVFIFECKEPSREAFRMGIAAAVLLVLAHAIANVHGGCVCIFSREEMNRSPANKQLAAVLSLINLVAIILAIGFSLLMIGGLPNRHSKAQCGLTHHKILSTGGILCFVHLVFIVAFYAVALSSHESPTYDESKMVRRAAAGNTEMAETGRQQLPHQQRQQRQ